MTLAAYMLPHTQANCLEVVQGAPGAHRCQGRLSKEDSVLAHRHYIHHHTQVFTPPAIKARADHTHSSSLQFGAHAPQHA